MKTIKLIEMSCSETSVEVEDNVYEELIKSPNIIYDLTRESTEKGDFSLYHKTCIEVEDENYETIKIIDL